MYYCSVLFIVCVTLPLGIGPIAVAEELNMGISLEEETQTLAI
jgi:hypothetical protein